MQAVRLHFVRFKLGGEGLRYCLDGEKKHDEKELMDDTHRLIIAPGSRKL